MNPGVRPSSVVFSQNIIFFENDKADPKQIWQDISGQKMLFGSRSSSGYVPSKVDQEGFKMVFKSFELLLKSIGTRLGSDVLLCTLQGRRAWYRIVIFSPFSRELLSPVTDHIWQDAAKQEDFLLLCSSCRSAASIGIQKLSLSQIWIFCSNILSPT